MLEPIINIAFLSCTYLQNGGGENTANRRLLLPFLMEASLMMPPNCQKRLLFCVVFQKKKLWMASVSASCGCCSSAFSSPGSTCLFLLLPHHFRNLMNCTNLRLTSNPIFLPLWPQTITGGESCTHTLGTWERVHACAHTHTHACAHLHCPSYTQIEVGLLIDRVIERFKIHLPSTVRQAQPCLELNRLRQSSSWSSWGGYL